MFFLLLEATARRWTLACAGGLIFLLAQVASGTAQPDIPSLLDARRGFTTKILRQKRDAKPLQQPHPNLFSMIQFPTPIGSMAAYLSRATNSDKKHPTIIWITGGLPPGGIDSSAWTPVSADNDQSAKAYRQAEIVMMYPTVRGSFGNPGTQEFFYGEVDDILAAMEYLRKVDYVDPDRIYLGGHSTGGTLALLVASATDRFQAVFSFGPIGNPANYGVDLLTFDHDNEMEILLRAPIVFLSTIKTPTFIFEGNAGNIESLQSMEQYGNSNQKLHFFTVNGADHFNLLAPINRLISSKIANLDRYQQLTLSKSEVQDAFAGKRMAK